MTSTTNSALTQAHVSFWNRPLPAQARRILFVLSFCILIMLLGMAPQASAQSAAAQTASAQAASTPVAVEQVPGDSGYWKQYAVAQISTLLQAPQEQMRMRGLELIIEFSSDDALARELDALRPQLYTLFFDVRNTDEERIQALTALRATNPVKTREALATWSEEEESPRVQQALRQRS